MIESIFIHYAIERGTYIATCAVITYVRNDDKRSHYSTK